MKGRLLKWLLDHPLQVQSSAYSPQFKSDKHIYKVWFPGPGCLCVAPIYEGMKATINTN